MATEDCPFKVVRSNGSDEVLARAINLVSGRAASETARRRIEATMDDRCHEAWREIGGFLDLGAGEAEDKGAKKGSKSAQVALGLVEASDSVHLKLCPLPTRPVRRSRDHRSPAC
jgi:hypothetical protein